MTLSTPAAEKAVFKNRIQNQSLETSEINILTQQRMFTEIYWLIFPQELF
jgi:hypothetical protein